MVNIADNLLLSYFITNGKHHNFDEQSDKSARI